MASPRSLLTPERQFESFAFKEISTEARARETGHVFFAPSASSRNFASSIPGNGFEPLPLWVALVVIGRDVGILAAGIGIYLATGFTGFTPTFLGKLNTCFEIGLVVLFLLTRAFYLPELLLTMGAYATACLVAVSGVHYVFHARKQLAKRGGGLRTA